MFSQDWQGQIQNLVKRSPIRHLRHKLKVRECFSQRKGPWDRPLTGSTHKLGAVPHRLSRPRPR